MIIRVDFVWTLIRTAIDWLSDEVSSQERPVRPVMTMEAELQGGGTSTGPGLWVALRCATSRSVRAQSSAFPGIVGLFT